MIAKEDIKIGAKVVFNYEGDWGDVNAVDGNEYWIVEDSGCGDDNFFTKHTVDLFAVQVNMDCFTLVVDSPEEITPLPWPRDESDSIARPILEERKVGKVRMELVDDGFANALLEIAKVLTWAQEAKGYLDHDWINLPDPENGFKGAASRHRVKANIQKMAGVEPKLRVDEESKLHHLAHQATNVLMELELILTGKIQ